MRYSANLNIIVKAIEKAAGRMPRDFIELENLQSNPISAAKFANACYSRAKNILIEDLVKFRPDYNIIFSDGEEIINKRDAEYRYVIFSIDGLANLSRSDPHFAIAIALEHIDATGKKEAIAVAVNNVIGNETYYCEKGFGAYASNRRLRVSKKTASDQFIAVVNDVDFIKSDKIKNASLRNFGCSMLEIAYLSCARIDAAIFKDSKDNQLLKPFMLLAREAGGKVIEKDNMIFISNGLINFS